MDLIQRVVELEQEVETLSRFRSDFLRTSTFAYLLIDSDFNIQEMNIGTTELFGYGPDELRGKNFEMLIPEDFRPQHRDHVHQFL